MNFRRSFTASVSTAVLFAFGIASMPVARAAEIAPAQYKVNVNITKVDGAKKTLVTDTVMLTSEGAAAPFQVVRDVPYVSEVRTVKDKSGNDVEEAKEVSHQSVGVTMNVRPVALTNGKILVDYTIDVSSLDSMQRVGLLDLLSITHRTLNGQVAVALNSPVTMKSGDKVMTITVSRL